MNILDMKTEEKVDPPRTNDRKTKTACAKCFKAVCSNHRAEICTDCRKKCMQQFTEEDKKEILSKLLSGSSKNEQDTYIQGLKEVKSIQRHRKRSSEDKQERKSNFLYFVRKGSNRISVCKKAFISLHAISHWQVQRLNTLLFAAKCPRDLRGKHNNRPGTICDEWTQKIKEHIEAFPVKVSHYCSKNIRYLDASLDVKKMHNLFIEKYPDLENFVKYEFYLKYFNEIFNLRFGRPQVDVCSECERYGTRLKDANLKENGKRAAASLHCLFVAFEAMYYDAAATNEDAAC
ncbi:unnamed protein product [Acanthoscelides obtectus]|uniref:Uncharacterized protein n=1 Tax=Acanthoscelides obtectus TaxID=200917 RepID=A0A9P0L1T7_ACAOB|nr:unnamed protein product [Acanthoscelides obtectus]CAK1635885.1 hypothetical protein AOBTE_LOCUS9592 [Acanthoscelides obtectus]